MSDHGFDWTISDFPDDPSRWLDVDEVRQAADGVSDPVDAYLLGLDVLAAVAHGQPDPEALTVAYTTAADARAVRLICEVPGPFVDAVVAALSACQVPEFRFKRVHAAIVSRAAIVEGDKMQALGTFAQLVHDFGPLACLVVHAMTRASGETGGTTRP